MATLKSYRSMLKQMHIETAWGLSTAHRRHASNKYLQDLEAEIVLTFDILPLPSTLLLDQQLTYKRIPSKNHY